MVVTQPNVARPSSSPTVEKKACGTEASLDAALVEGIPDEKDSLVLIAPLSWDEMMEMLKRVLCFTDTETPF